MVATRPQPKGTDQHISTSPTGAVSSDAVAMLPPTTSLSISNFPPSSSRLSSPLVTSLMTSFHHSVRFGDLAIPTAVGVVMVTLMTLMWIMMMNFFRRGHVTARAGVGYIGLPISIQSCSPSSTANH